MRIFLATLSGAVVQFLLGWLVYGLLLASFMGDNCNSFPGLMKDMNTASFYILTFISGLVMSFMIAYIFQYWAKFDKFLKGLLGGMFIGFFMALTYDLFSFAMMNLITVQSLIVDVISNTIIVGIIGGVIACVLGYKVKAAPSQ
jgi:hypothetical protein